MEYPCIINLLKKPKRVPCPATHFCEGGNNANLTLKLVQGVDIKRFNLYIFTIVWTILTFLQTNSRKEVILS